MDFVAVDLGASNTRYMTVGGNVKWMPNNVFFVADMGANLNNERQDDTIENNLDISIWKEGTSEYFPMRALIGPMATRIGTSVQTPSQLMEKVKQPINYLSALASVALSKHTNPELGDKINLFIALPPREITGNRFKMKEILKGKYTVALNKIGANGTTIQFEINNVICYEESRMALMQYILDENHPERMNTMMDCNVLSIDIGASTTDFVVFQNGGYLDKSGRTYPVGGNLVRDYVINNIGSRMGIDANTTMADTCLREGRIPYGSGFKVASEILVEAKEVVAKNIIGKMDQYFSGIELPIYNFSYIIVSGGGSMESSYIDDSGKRVETTPPMSKFITDMVKTVCSEVQVLHFGDEPRLANIRGLGAVALLKNGEIDD